MTHTGKCYWVERDSGGYSEPYTFEDACQIAEEDSVENSSFMFVRHNTGYVPTRIYYCGHIYEQLEKGKDES